MRKKIMPYLLIALVLLVASGLYVYYQYNRKNTETTSIKPDFIFAAPELVKAFQSDENAANTRYLGKVMEVSGTIKSLDKDQSGLYTVVIGDTESMSSVRCSMGTRSADDSLRFTIGAAITIKGFCTGFTADDMGLGADVILNRSVVSHSSNHSIK